MITIRRKMVEPRPLTLTQVGQVIDNMRVVSRSGDKNLLDPAIRPHFLRIVAMSIKSNFPGASLDELADELLDALSPEDLLMIVPIVFDPEHYAQFVNINVRKEHAHG